METGIKSSYRLGLLALGFAFASLAVSGCAKTVSDQSAVVKQMESRPSAATSSFFGEDFPKLQPGQEGQAAMVYVDANANWKQYDKVMLEPVEFWDGSDTKVSPQDQHTLTAYFYNKLKEDLQKNFTIVDQGGPGVLQLQVALTNASTSTPGLRTVSVLVPQARVLNAAQSLATDSYAFAGSAEAQMKASDSVTGQFLAGAIDKRSGGVALSNAASFKWGDAESAMDYWADKISSRLLELQGRAPASK